MTIEEPSPDVLEDVDDDAIRELTNEAYDLAQRHGGHIPSLAWDSLWKRALEAAKGHEELLEGVWRWRPKG